MYSLHAVLYPLNPAKTLGRPFRLATMELRDADIVLEMSVRDWNAYLRQRAKGKGPSLLTLDLDKRVVTGRSPLDRLKLERYNLSLQAFIDKGAELAA